MMGRVLTAAGKNARFQVIASKCVTGRCSLRGFASRLAVATSGTARSQQRPMLLTSVLLAICGARWRCSEHVRCTCTAIRSTLSPESAAPRQGTCVVLMPVAALGSCNGGIGRGTDPSQAHARRLRFALPRAR